jgi:PAS domain S-box-containing protein
MLCSILLLDEKNRLRHGAAPSLPRTMIEGIDGQAIGPTAGSCGAAAFHKQRIVIPDIATHPNWAPYKHLALPHGLRSCWSTPIVSSHGTVLGTFAMYYREPRLPTAAEIEWVASATHLTSIAIARQKTDALEEAMRAGDALRTLVIDTVSQAVFYLHVDGPDRFRFVSVNRAFRQLFKAQADTIIGKYLHELAPEDVWASIVQRYRTAATTHERVTWEEEWTGNEDVLRIEVTIAPIIDAQGRCTDYVGTAQDITARIRAEAERSHLVAQLNQAQRMQALGTLAGGIAHDFNNILAALSGNAALLLQERDLAPAHRIHVLEIQKASRRAIDLVRQILTFSRRAPPKRESLDPAELTAEALNMLRATLPQTIAIESQIAPDAPRVEGDATQFHQVLMNLGTNAAHALPARGGVIRFVIDSVDIDGPLDASPELASGRYLRMRVVDNGCGMDEPTLKRAFDPFFTTRKPGEGTGLGLSVVHGIVQSHHGAVELRSRVGEGTVVTIYLPASESVPESRARPSETLGAGERVMYVDDEEALVFLIDRALTKMGYQVDGYADPTLALGTFRSRPDDFDVVVTDLSMPGLSGPDLATEMRRIRPDIPIIMTSGFIRPEDVRMARRLGINQLIYMANTIEELGEALAREIARLPGRPPPPIANGAASP